jgi:hypothetical protein
MAQQATTGCDNVINIEFTPEMPLSPEDEYEQAKLQVVALLDDPAWHWLAAQINDQRLTWPEVFDLVAANS